MKSRKRSAGRKPGKQMYKSPKLVTYGDLRQLTNEKQGNKGDGGGKPNTRTGGAPA